MEIGLGTVQLGLPYGNRSDLPLMSEETAFGVLDEAVRCGILFFDTAASYGESESRVGSYQKKRGVNSLSISTKVPITGRDIWSDPAAYERFVRHTLRESFTKLGVSSLGLLQFHQHDLDFLSSAHVSELMATLIREGICEEVGVSVYEPVEAEQALSVESVGVLQIPVHLLDHRFLDASLRRKYLDANVRLIARSIFFQGLLVEGAALPPVARKEELASVKRRAMGIASQAGVPLEELAVRFLVGNLDGFIDVALMGVDSAQALRENMELVQRAKGKLLSLEILEEFQTLSEEVRELGLLSPAHWGAK